MSVTASPLSVEQEAWLRVFDIAMRVRLGPAIITSTTADAVKTSIVQDAYGMAKVAFPLVMSDLAELSPQVAQVAP